jgi:hypothetical protein
MVRPGGGLVVGAAGLEAAVQDADQAAAELAQRCVVADAAGSQLVVVGAGAGCGAQRRERLPVERVEEPVVVQVAGQYGLLLPDWRVIGLVPA